MLQYNSTYSLMISLYLMRFLGAVPAAVPRAVLVFFVTSFHLVSVMYKTLLYFTCVPAVLAPATECHNSFYIAYFPSQYLLFTIVSVH